VAEGVFSIVKWSKLMNILPDVAFTAMVVHMIVIQEHFYPNDNI
jgi:hypothetical protein